jgi:NAD(P)H-nitrite reductase large subunit
MQKVYLVIGASAAGIGALSKLVKLKGADKIICVSDEQELPYNKCFLVDYLSSEKTLEQVHTKAKDFFDQHDVELKLNTRVISIDAHNKQATCADGSKIAYTKLLLGIGGSLALPPITGKDTDGVFPFYNLHDTKNIKHWIEQENVKNVVIIGAGLSGIECADALKECNVSITVIDKNTQVLGRQVDAEGAQFIQQKAQGFGINFWFNVTINKIVSEGGRVCAIELSDGRILKAGMVICALGARPNLALAESAGLNITDYAVETNEWMQTSNPDIYAAGDVALITNKLTGTKMRSCMWPDALVQGMSAGTNMVEHTKPYAGITLITASHFFGLSFHVAGDFSFQGTLPCPAKLYAKPGSDSAKNCIEGPKVEQTQTYYQKLALSESGAVKGFMLIGHTQHLSRFKRSLLTQTPL